jgi:hypothetical protein
LKINRPNLRLGRPFFVNHTPHTRDASKELEDRVAAAESRIQSLEVKFRACEVKSRWRKSLLKKQQLEDQTKAFHATSPKRKIASCITVRPTAPALPISQTLPQEVETKPVEEPLSKINDSKPAETCQAIEKKPEAESQPDPEPEFQVINSLVQALKIQEPESESPTEAKVEVSNVQGNPETTAFVEENHEEEFDTPLVHHLIVMGFEKSKVKKAVEKYSDMESALNHLLDEN